jgi:hypothetical protein
MPGNWSCFICRVSFQLRNVLRPLFPVLMVRAYNGRRTVVDAACSASVNPVNRRGLA